MRIKPVREVRPKQVWGLSLRCLALLCLALGSGSCESSLDMAPLQSQVDELYRAVVEERIEDLLDMYSDEFYQHVPRSEWRDTLVDISTTLGAYLTRAFVKPIVLSSMKTGTTVTLIYDVEYANHRVVEQITFRTNRNGNPAQLIHHQFNTDLALPRQATSG